MVMRKGGMERKGSTRSEQMGKNKDEIKLKMGVEAMQLD